MVESDEVDFSKALTYPSVCFNKKSFEFNAALSFLRSHISLLFMTQNPNGTTLRTFLPLLTALILFNSACTIGNYNPAELSKKSLVDSLDQKDPREFLCFSYIPESRDKLESNPF